MSDIATSRVQQSVSFDVAKKKCKTESSCSTPSRVGSASLQAIADSTETRAKSSNSFNPSKVSIESSNSEKQSVTVSPKISRFKQIQQKVAAFGKSIIAAVKAHPYETAVVVVASSVTVIVASSVVLAVRSGLKVRQALQHELALTRIYYQTQEFFDAMNETAKIIERYRDFL